MPTNCYKKKRMQTNKSERLSLYIKFKKYYTVKDISPVVSHSHLVKKLKVKLIFQFQITIKKTVHLLAIFSNSKILFTYAEKMFIVIQTLF